MTTTQCTKCGSFCDTSLITNRVEISSSGNTQEKVCNTCYFLINKAERQGED